MNTLYGIFKDGIFQEGLGYFTSQVAAQNSLDVFMFKVSRYMLPPPNKFTVSAVPYFLRSTAQPKETEKNPAGIYTAAEMGTFVADSEGSKVSNAVQHHLLCLFTEWREAVTEGRLAVPSAYGYRGAGDESEELCRAIVKSLRDLGYGAEYYTGCGFKHISVSC